MDLEQQSRFGYFRNFVSPDERGIEIGPLTRPTFPAETGYTVESLDHADTETLVKKYENDPHIEVEKIQPTDWVWTGGSYTSIPGIPTDFDFLVSCHSIEHSEDLVQFLKDCSELLREGGLVLLTVPDKRLEFDFYRPTTTLGDALMGHYFPAALDFKARVDDLELSSRLNGDISWSEARGVQAAIAGNRPVPIRSDSQLVDELASIDSWSEETGYRDAHRWVFEPITLMRIVEGLRSLGLIDLVVIDYEQGIGCEFMMVLRKGPDAKKNLRFSTSEYRESLVPIEYHQQGLLSTLAPHRLSVLSRAFGRRLRRAPGALKRRIVRALSR